MASCVTSPRLLLGVLAGAVGFGILDAHLAADCDNKCRDRFISKYDYGPGAGKRVKGCDRWKMADCYVCRPVGALGLCDKSNPVQPGTCQPSNLMNQQVMEFVWYDCLSLCGLPNPPYEVEATFNYDETEWKVLLNPPWRCMGNEEDPPPGP